MRKMQFGNEHQAKGLLISCMAFQRSKFIYLQSSSFPLGHNTQRNEKEGQKKNDNKTEECVACMLSFASVHMLSCLRYPATLINLQFLSLHLTVTEITCVFMILYCLTIISQYVCCFLCFLLYSLQFLSLHLSHWDNLCVHDHDGVFALVNQSCVHFCQWLLIGLLNGREIYSVFFDYREAFNSVPPYPCWKISILTAPF